MDGDGEGIGRFAFGDLIGEIAMHLELDLSCLQMASTSFSAHLHVSSETRHSGSFSICICSLRVSAGMPAS